jgi:hypothetical protein
MSWRQFRVIGDDLIGRLPLGQPTEHVGHADAQVAHAGLAASAQRIGGDWRCSGLGFVHPTSLKPGVGCTRGLRLNTKSLMFLAFAAIWRRDPVCE